MFHNNIYFKYLGIVLVSVIYFNLFSYDLVYADEEKVQIVFAGTLFAGKEYEEIVGKEAKKEAKTASKHNNIMGKDFKHLLVNRSECEKLINQRIKKYQFPFDLVNSSGLENKKLFEESDNPLSFFILITKDTLYTENYKRKDIMLSESKQLIGIIKKWDIDIKSANSIAERKKLITEFKDGFKLKKNTYAVLIVSVPVANHREWTIAGYTDKGEYKEKEIKNVNDPLVKELNKEKFYTDEIKELVKPHLGYTDSYIKYFFDVGLSAYFYTPVTSMTPIKNMHKIEFSIPVIVQKVDFRKNVPDDFLLATEETEIFSEVFEYALDKLLEKVAMINPRRLQAKVRKVSGNSVHIDAGKKDGIFENEKVMSKSVSGRIVKLKKGSAVIKCTKGKFHKGDVIDFYICKSDDTETYRVVDVEITSKNARKIFKRQGESGNFEALCAEWYSIYLAHRTGAVVLPSKIGTTYSSHATRAIVSAYDLDEKNINFEIPDAKYKVKLNITGIAKKLIEEIDKSALIYKVWIERDINGQKKEISEYIDNVVTSGDYKSDYQVFNEVVLQALAKLANDL